MRSYLLTRSPDSEHSSLRRLTGGRVAPRQICPLSAVKFQPMAGRLRLDCSEDLLLALPPGHHWAPARASLFLQSLRSSNSGSLLSLLSSHFLPHARSTKHEARSTKHEARSTKDEGQSRIETITNYESLTKAEYLTLTQSTVLGTFALVTCRCRIKIKPGRKSRPSLYHTVSPLLLLFLVLLL